MMILSTSVKCLNESRDTLPRNTEKLTKKAAEISPYLQSECGYWKLAHQLYWQIVVSVWFCQKWRWNPYGSTSIFYKMNSHEQNSKRVVIAMVSGHGWNRKSLIWYRKRSPFLVKLTWEKTNQKGAGRYLPTGNHSGCDAVYIQKRRCVLRQTFQQSGLHAAQSGNRAAGLSEGSHGLCVYRYEMRGFHADHRSDGLSGHQCVEADHGQAGAEAVWAGPGLYALFLFAGWSPLFHSLRSFVLGLVLLISMKKIFMPE